jgi:hypothetical protein
MPVPANSLENSVRSVQSATMVLVLRPFLLPVLFPVSRNHRLRTVRLPLSPFGDGGLACRLPRLWTVGDRLLRLRTGLHRLTRLTVADR